MTTERLEYLRGEIRAERISYSEIAELQGLADQIDPGDVELLQWAGVPEHPEDEEVFIKLVLSPTLLENIDMNDGTGLTGLAHDELIRTLGSLGFDLVDGPTRLYDYDTEVG